jgi:hypothetical protein
MIASSVFFAPGASHFCKSTQLRFLKGKSPLKLGVICDFFSQSKLLGGRTPQTPRWVRGAVTERVEVPPPNPGAH